MRRPLLLAAVLSAAACGTEPAGETPGGGGKGDDPSGDPELAERAAANLARVAAEIDRTHLASYGLDGGTAEQFFQALELEYADGEPEQFAARLRALASMVFFAAPDLVPPAGGRITPFHGLDMDQLEALIAIEDEVWASLVDRNGGSGDGVRPFSVCETRYMIETFVRPRVAPGSMADYAAGYRAFAAACPQADLDEWYSFRGLGALRPSWVESNVMDRFLRRMASRCQGPDPGWEEECAGWEEDRLGYRIAKNREMAARFMHYDPAQEARLADTSDEVVLFEDRSGDGVAELLMNGPAALTSGEPIDFAIMKTGDFTGLMKADVDGSMISVRAENLAPDQAAHPAITRALVEEADMGLTTVFADPTGCTGEAPAPEECPLLQRFHVLIDRHEDFYQTYTALRPDSASISSQPSPLVACSITLGAAHAWDTAGTPPGGAAGFIFLMRIPFDQILAGSEASVATLEPGPDVLSIGDLYAGAELDMSRVWLDIATLSHNAFAGEHEVSKLGAVPAEQIEGILVVRTPAAMDE